MADFPLDFFKTQKKTADNYSNQFDPSNCVIGDGFGEREKRKDDENYGLERRVEKVINRFHKSEEA